uniref:Leucine-rich repeat extensin-like protein 3 n=1 Tax=Nelumbo nucifera TaxID=4432 RepID=A0A822ZZT2_NELNU|nr:TPA_asm: hypothetical protein HUJ06_018978 [Nelumbo nucifera]
MGHRGFLIGLVRVGIMGMILFARVSLEDRIGQPSTGLLCISDCVTCPVICAPPPPPPSPPPPPVHHSPSQSHDLHRPLPPSTRATPPPPPPPSDYLNIIPSVPSPPTVGQQTSSYPYHYFYASKAASLTLPASFASWLTILLFCCITFVCC